MRTVTFKSVLEGVSAWLGNDPAQVQTVEQARLCEFINARVREGWEYDFWPEWTVVEERLFRAEWTATAYAADTELWHADTEKYWVSNDSVLGADVPGVSAKWDELTSFERYVSLDQEGKTPIGEVRSVARSNQRTALRPGYLGFSIVDTGIVPDYRAGNSVFVEFRKRPPVFTTTAYDASTTYFEGDVVYYSTTGECYRAIDNNFSAQTPVQVAYWEKVDFPHVLEAFVKRAAYADALRPRGQQEKAVAEEASAYRFLTQAADAAGPSQGYYDTAAVRTY